MRSLGGSIGLAIAVIIFNSRIRNSGPLKQALASAQTAALYKSPLAIESFSPPQQALVAGVYAEAFAQEMRVATYVAAFGLLLSLCTFDRISFRRAKKREHSQSAQDPVVVNASSESNADRPGTDSLADEQGVVPGPGLPEHVELVPAGPPAARVEPALQRLGKVGRQWPWRSTVSPS